MYEYPNLFIGGQWVPSTGSARITVHSPHSLDLVGSVPDATVDDVDKAVIAARRAFDQTDWPDLPVTERAAAIGRLKKAYLSRIPLIAELHARQMGCPIAFATPLHAQLPVTVLDYYEKLADTYVFEETRPGLGHDSLVSRRPIGVVGAIIPWNGPTFLAICKLAPAILAGCSVVLKPSP